MRRTPLVILTCLLVSCSELALRVICSKAGLVANGYDVSQVKVYGTRQRPIISIAGEHSGLRLSGPSWKVDHWESEVQAGIMPATVLVHVSQGKRHVEQKITISPDTTDSASDGTPDYLRLDEDSDRAAFRRGFTYSAERQYFLRPELRAAQVTDCSALVRYAYIEAIREHTDNLVGASIRKYSYPHTPLGPAIFRVRTGTYLESDVTNGAFSEFADVQMLWRDNTFFVSRDISRAQPGDLLFYRRYGQHGLTYHSMIFLGRSQLQPGEDRYVVYHSGPDGSNGSSPGEIRRLSVTQLLHFPNPQWQAWTANPLFLGVYRWNILKAVS